MGTTAGKLAHLAACKADIKAAIEVLGVTVGDAVFADYGVIIMQAKPPYSDAAVIARLDGTLFNSAPNASLTLGSLGAAITYSTGKNASAYNATLANRIHINSISLSSDYTISAWVKLNAANALRRLFDLSSGAYCGVELTYSDSKFVLHASNVGGVNQITTAGYADGDWHFVVLRKKGTMCSLSVDNATLLSTTNTSGALNFVAVSNDVYPLHGYVDQWCVWDRALEDIELKWLWNNGNGRIN